MINLINIINFEQKNHNLYWRIQYFNFDAILDVTNDVIYDT